MKSRFGSWFSKLLSSAALVLRDRPETTFEIAMVSHGQVREAVKRFVRLGTMNCSDFDEIYAHFSNPPEKQSPEEIRRAHMGQPVSERYCIASLPRLIAAFESDNLMFRDLKMAGVRDLADLRSDLTEASDDLSKRKEIVYLFQPVSRICGRHSPFDCTMDDIIRISDRQLDALTKARDGAVELAVRDLPLVLERKGGLLSRIFPAG